MNLSIWAVWSLLMCMAYYEKDIRSRIAMGKKAHTDKRKLFSSTVKLDLRKRIIKCFV